MPRYMGICVQGVAVTIVDADEVGDSFTVRNDTTWTLQDGPRPQAYDVMYQRVRDYVTENEISVVGLKGSSGGQQAARQSLLDGAELRGVVTAAVVAAGASIHVHKKSSLSRTFGERKVDQYVSDDDYWVKEFDGKMRKGSREAAFMILASR